VNDDGKGMRTRTVLEVEGRTIRAWSGMATIERVRDELPDSLSSSGCYCNEEPIFEGEQGANWFGLVGGPCVHDDRSRSARASTGVSPEIGR
jgi:hypothetical protein